MRVGACDDCEWMKTYCASNRVCPPNDPPPCHLPWLGLKRRSRPAGFVGSKTLERREGVSSVAAAAAASKAEVKTVAVKEKSKKKAKGKAKAKGKGKGKKKGKKKSKGK